MIVEDGINLQTKPIQKFKSNINNIKTLEELANAIISNIKPNWSNLKKIRYIYLCLGIFLEKHTDFFLSFDGKLQHLNLSKEELEKIYVNDPTLENKDWYKVLCKSAAETLKYCFDKIGISSKLMYGLDETNNHDNSLTINHWFLAVNDDDKTYFLTLSADLSNIKNGLKTEHFATYISYEKIDRNTKEKKQVYYGEHIYETALSNEDLQEIDSELGYIDNIIVLDRELRLTQKNKYPAGKHIVYDDFFLEYIRLKLKNNKWLIELLAPTTQFYKNVIQHFDRNLNELKPEELNYIKEYIIAHTNARCNMINEYLLEKYQIKKEINLMSTELLKLPIPLAETIMDDLYYKQCKDLEKNTFIFCEKKLNTYINNMPLNQNQLKKLKNDLNNYINLLSFGFSNNEPVLNYYYKPKITNNYISTKLLIVLSAIFNCNNNVEDFNKQGYSEQKEIIDKVIPIIFDDDNLSEDTARKLCLEPEKYRATYPPISNIIRTYTIRNINTNLYSTVLHIPNNCTGKEIFLLFNLPDNKLEILRPTQLIELKKDYLIISDTLNKAIKDIENIEVKK